MASFETARFHVRTGPASLFERVLFKMRTTRSISTTNRHFSIQANFRDIPRDAIADFWSPTWEIMEAEVRTDKGKFVSTTWRKPVSGRYLWIVIGFGEAVKTGYWDGDPFPSSMIVKSGPLYQMVDDVNRTLMAAEATLPASSVPRPV